MMFGIISLRAALIFCGVCADARQLTPDQNPAAAGDGDRSADVGSPAGHGLPRRSPCLADDVFAVLRESLGEGGELTNQSLTQFGICAAPGHHTDSLLEFLKETSKRDWPQILHPSAALSEDTESGTLWLTLDLPPSEWPKLKHPVVLLALERPPAGTLQVTFSSGWLQPDKQTACLSADTLYIVLTGTAPNVDQAWRISAAVASEMKQSLKELLIGGKSGSAVSAVPVLLSSGETGSETRFPSKRRRLFWKFSRVPQRRLFISASLRVASQTSSFLCELKRFLAGVTPQEHQEPPPLQLSSLQSLPPLTLDRSTSEATLARLIHSPSLTVLAFGDCCSSSSQGHQGELALSPALTEELRRRLERTITHIMEVIREEEAGQAAMRRLGRLMHLSAFLRDDPAPGQSQYRAFLLLKALQTVGRTYEVKRGLRAIRADSDTPAREKPCELRSFTMSLKRFAMGPSTANINNCHGVCSFPMVNTINHAALLNAYIDSKRAANEAVDQRAPCCVPVAYEDMDMVLLHASGNSTVLQTLSDVVVRECGCR